jgi:phosphoglycerate dehydrogenase-like enzyme
MPIDRQGKGPLVIVVLDEAYRAAAAGRFPGSEVHYFPSDLTDAEAFAQIIQPATALGLRRPLGFPFNEKLVEAARDLQFIQKSGSGTDWFDIEALNRLGILLAVNSGVNAVSVAEHTVMLILTCLRDGFGSMQRMRDGVWERTGTSLQPVLLDGKTVGVIGMGAIGTRVARAITALGARVLTTRPPRDEAAELTVVSLDDLLREADVVTLHVPLTDATRGMIGPRELALMKPTAVIINTSRGQVIDEPALSEALRDGRLRAAGLDVFQQEPTPADNPLLALDNVYATPHIGGLAKEINARQVESTLANIERFLSGERPDLLVNPEVLDGQSARAAHLREG